MKISSEKAAPQLGTLRRAISSLTEGLIFRYPKFSLTPHDGKKIDVVLDAFAKEGKLLRGKWRKNQWLGVVVFEKMARAWLLAGLEQGCLSWDVHLHKLLSLTLAVALNARVGDVARTQHYHVEFMKFGHIQIKLPEGGATVEDLEAFVTICHEKAKK